MDISLGYRFETRLEAGPCAVDYDLLPVYGVEGGDYAKWDEGW